MPFHIPRDPSNSIGSRNLSVLTSTLIGVATESSLNRFSILLSALFPVAKVTIETLQSPGNRGFEGRKSSVGSTVFYIRPPKSNFGIWHPNLKFEFLLSNFTSK